MKFLLFLLITSQAIAGFAQPKVSTLDVLPIKNKIAIKGDVVSSMQWTDSLGQHYLILTETGIKQSTTSNEDFEDYREAALYGYHYIQEADSIKLLWRVYDFVKECPFDVTLKFVKGAITITDLDKNGKAEVWLPYRLACRSDVSPAEFKIIMYEHDKKYAMRGTARVEYGGDSMGGEYKFDAAFSGADEVFRQYAAKLWKKNMKDTFE